MSIINDALKKTQMTFKKKDKAPEKNPEPQADQSPSNVYEKLYKTQQDLQKVAAAGRDSKQRPSGKQGPKSPPTRKWLQTSVAIIIFLLIAYGSFFFLSRYQPVKDFFHSIKNNGVESRSHIAQQAPKRRKYKPGELVLNGTSLIDGKRVALINDEIYEIGDTVSGKKITSINLNQIELRDNEKIITLKVH